MSGDRPANGPKERSARFQKLHSSESATLDDMVVFVCGAISQAAGTWLRVNSFHGGRPDEMVWGVLLVPCGRQG